MNAAVPPPSTARLSSRRCRNRNVSGTPRCSHAPARRSRCGRVISSAPATITAGVAAVLADPVLANTGLANTGLADTWTVSHWTARAVSISPRALRAAGSRARQVYQAGVGGGDRTGAYPV